MKNCANLGDLPNMINKQLYRNNPLHVEAIIEVRLCYDTWRKIQRIARSQHASYSWVVRFAVFRLIKRKNINSFLSLNTDEYSFQWRNRSEKYDSMNEKARIRRQNCNEKHRHRLCLYGTDELFIRVTAARLSCTMTHLVRLALEVYLDSVLRHSLRAPRFGGRKYRSIREAFWYWCGIKLHEDVEFPNYAPEKQYIKFKKFDKHDYF